MTTTFINGLPFFTTGTTSAAIATNTAFQTTVVSMSNEFSAHHTGRELSLPPKVGMYITEASKGSKFREIIDVSCGNHIICKGKRHSLIAWKNLGRYVEVPNPITGKFVN